MGKAKGGIANLSSLLFSIEGGKLGGGGEDQKATLYTPVWKQAGVLSRKYVVMTQYSLRALMLMQPHCSSYCNLLNGGLLIIQIILSGATVWL